MNRIKKVFLSIALSFSLLLGAGLMASASTTDQSFSFTVNSSSGTFTRNSEITSRLKETDTKVYVYITSAPYTYIQIKTWGRRNTSSTYYNETVGGVATVQNGVQSSITNNIYENAGYSSTYSYITLRSAGSGGTVSGKWSPDSSRNYTIVN